MKFFSFRLKHSIRICLFFFVCVCLFYIFNKLAVDFERKLYKNFPFFFLSFVQLNAATATFLNGKSVQRNELSKRKTALGDIKNYAPVTPGIGCEKKSTNKLNADQLNLLTEIDYMSFAQPNPSDCCSSKPVDYDKIWAERLALTDAEVDCILSNGFYRDDDIHLLPPPPSPNDMESMCKM